VEYQYKLILINKSMCKEFIITENMTEILLGTTAECSFRLNRENFFEDIKISLIKKNKVWQAVCNDGLYFSKGGSGKLMVAELKHGDVISLRYTESGNIRWRAL